MLYDLAIIGGGPAGYSAALEAARLNLKVILFEESLLGGTCLNRGCVPTKFLAHTSEVFEQAKNCSRYGIEVSDAKINYQNTIIEEKEVVLNLRKNLEQFIYQNKIQIVYGAAEMLDNSHINVNSDIYEAKNTLIATGSKPVVPLFDNAITSDELLELDYIPHSIKIIGGGVVAVEFANIFNLLGSKVTINIRGNRILRKWEKELALGLTQNMKAKGITVQTNCNCEQMYDNSAEILLSAIGRVPNLSGINSQYIDLGMDGGIVIDEYGRTKTEGIYAAGDVIENSPQLAHVAMEQGKRVAQCVAGVQVQKNATIVKCIYVKPEIASVGMTEDEAKCKGINAISAKQIMYSNARSLIATRDRGFVKIVADMDTNKIIGAQLMCERAGDIAGELALAINNELTVQELYQSTRPHPSFCEVITDVAVELRRKIG